MKVDQGQVTAAITAGDRGRRTATILWQRRRRCVGAARRPGCRDLSSQCCPRRAICDSGAARACGMRIVGGRRFPFRNQVRRSVPGSGGDQYRRRRGRNELTLAVARREEWREQVKLARLLDKWPDPACSPWTATDPVAPSVTSGAMRKKRGVKPGVIAEPAVASVTMPRAMTSPHRAPRKQQIRLSRARRFQKSIRRHTR